MLSHPPMSNGLIKENFMENQEEKSRAWKPIDQRTPREKRIDKYKYISVYALIMAIAGLAIFFML